MTSTSDDTFDLNQGVQVDLSEISELIFNGEVLDSDIDLALDIFVAWEVVVGDFESNTIQVRDNDGRLETDPDSKSFVNVTDMLIVDLQALFVIRTHFINSVDIDEFAIIFKVHEEFSECSSDPSDSSGLFDPDVKVASGFGYIKISLIVFSLIFFIDFVETIFKHLISFSLSSQKVSL